MDSKEVPIPTLHENPNFRNFIRSLLERADLSEKYIDKLTDEKAMIEFTKAFTHKSHNPFYNYEFYETLGDATSNKVVVWYFQRRFPELFDPTSGMKEGNMGPLAIISRLKQNGVSKKTYAKFSGDLGFWDYIIGSEEAKKSKLKLLEDTFESFIGCLEYMIDGQVMEHSGYGICYIFMKKIMDKIEISLGREDLYDHKSLLNEEIMKFKKMLSIRYESIDNASRDPMFLENKSNIPFRFESVVVITDDRGREYRSGKGYGSDKTISQKNAAKILLESKFLDRFPKPKPKVF